MQLPIIPSRGQYKPWASIPRINWAHPLARGLIFYGYDTGVGPIDLVSGKLRTIGNSAILTGTKASRYGQGIVYAAGATASGAAAINFPNSASIGALTTAAPWSFAAGFMMTVTSDATLRVLFGTSDTAGVTPCDLSYQSGKYSFEFANGAQQVSNASTVTNTFQSLVGTTPVSGTANMYVNGAFDKTAAITTIETLTAQQPVFSGFQPTSATQGFVDGFVYFGALWKGRSLSAADAWLLHNDPYCFLIYPEDEMFATLVGVTVTPGVTAAASRSTLMMMGVG